MTGQFNVVKFYETFAAIIAEREQVKISVTVRRKECVEDFETSTQDPSSIADGGDKNF